MNLDVFWMITNVNFEQVRENDVKQWKLSFDLLQAKQAEPSY